jgi:methyl-accepting chemotaxis protein
LNFGFAAVIVLLVVVTAIAGWSLQGASEGFVDYHYQTVNAQRVNDFQDHLLNIRLAVKNVILHASETALQDYRQHFDPMMAFLKVMQSNIRHPERLQLVTEASERVAQYDRAFEQVVTWVKQRDEIRQRSIETLQRIQKALTPLNDAVAVSDESLTMSLANTLHIRFLNSRASLFKFLESHTPEDFAQLEKEVTGMAQVEIALTAQAGDAYRTHLDRFRQEYTMLGVLLPELNQAIRQSDDLVKNTLDQIEPEITAITTRLIEQIIKDRDALGATVQGNNTWSVQVLTGISLAAAFFWLGCWLN